jgi:protein-disulfide isomerase
VVVLVSAAVIAVTIVAVVGYLVLSRTPAKQVASNTGPGGAIRVTSNKLVTKLGGSEPKVVLSLYEDFLCPARGRFEEAFGPTVSRLIDGGKVAADYYPVAILDSPANQDYSSRAGAAAHCVAHESSDAFRRFHAALFSIGTQPAETGSAFPDNAALIQLARQAGAAGDVATCINSGKYLSSVRDMASAGRVSGTPTVRINGEDYDPSKPEDLDARIQAILGTTSDL